ncbi:MAG: PQQ-binding-like beta-propeller repeat protein [Acidimicrobiales bacterium]
MGARALVGRIALAAAAVLCLVGVSTTTTAGAVTVTPTPGDWPSYLFGTAHSSYNPQATAITPTDTGNLQPVWQWMPPAPTNGGTADLLASPTVVHGIVFIGDKDGEFYAYDETTRALLWSDFLGLDTAKGSCGTGDSLGIISTATVAPDPTTGKETVYVNAPDGHLYAIDASTGAVLWKGLVDTPSTTVNDYYAWGSPAVANGKVYIGISSDCDSPLVPGGLVSFDQETGATIATWNSLPRGDLGGSIWSSPAIMPDGSVIVTTGNGYASSGQPLYDESIIRLDGTALTVLDAWQVPPSQQVFDSDFGASPTLFTATLNGVATPMVGACNKNGLYYAFAQDHLSAGPVWQYQMTVPYPGGAEECDAGAIWDGTNLIEAGGAPTTINGVTYMGSVRSLNPATGQPLWQTGLTGTIVGSPSEDGAGVVAAPTYQSSDGQLGVYLLNASSGAIIGFIPTPHSPLFGQAVFAGNDLLLGAGPAFGLTDYEITKPGPPITKVSPATVAPGASTALTLTGSGFTGKPKIFLPGGYVVTKGVKVVSSTKLAFTATVESGAALGARGITVIEPGTPHTADTCAACVTVGAPPTPPTVASLTPSTVTAGKANQAVTLVGTGFESGVTVTSHGGITVKATFVSATDLGLKVSVTGSVAAGSYNLLVTNPDGGKVTCTDCLAVTG